MRGFLSLIENRRSRSTDNPAGSPAVVIEEPQLAFYGSQFGMTFPSGRLRDLAPAHPGGQLNQQQFGGVWIDLACRLDHQPSLMWTLDNLPLRLDALRKLQTLEWIVRTQGRLSVVAQTAGSGGTEPIIPKPKTIGIKGLGKLRYVVEQTVSLLHQFRRLAVRWERRLDIHDGLVSLAGSSKLVGV